MLSLQFKTLPLVAQAFLPVLLGFSGRCRGRSWDENVGAPTYFGYVTIRITHPTPLFFVCAGIIGLTGRVSRWCGNDWTYGRKTVHSCQLTVHSPRPFLLPVPDVRHRRECLWKIRQRRFPRWNDWSYQWRGVPPCFCVCRGNKGVTGAFRGCRGMIGVRRGRRAKKNKERGEIVGRCREGTRAAGARVFTWT